MAVITDVIIDVDISKLKSQLAEARNEVSSLKSEIADAPNATKAFNNSVERTIAVLDLLDEKVENLGSASKNEKEKLLPDIMSGLQDIEISRQLLGAADSSFSTTFAKKIFGKLPEAARKELNAVTPEIVRAIQSYSNHFKSADPGLMATQFANSSEFKRVSAK